MTKRQRLISIVIISVLLIGILFFALDRKGQQEAEEASYSQLTGEKVAPEAARRPVLAAIIENSPAARPQAGLDSAGIVFEAVTEGGITRYLALYQEDMPETVGPVRSLRMHFLNWAMGFDASVAHVGGSPEALETAEDRKAKSLNQFKYPEPYFRIQSRQAPHNMYAETDKLRELQAELEHGQSRFDKILRSQDNPSRQPEAPEITIDFSNPTYEASFRYDPSTNSYTRYLADGPHIDAATGDPITVKNVVILRVDNDEHNSLGEGDALVFKDGDVYQARWQQSSYRERLEIVDSEGNQIRFNRGDIWIAAVGQRKNVTY